MGALADMLKRVQNPEPLMRAVGQHMVGVTRRAFRGDQQGRPPGSWAPRMNPNIPGILSDLKAGRTPPARRWTDRPANVDTNALARSISAEVTSPTSVRVGSTLPYASEAQRGGPIVIPIDASLKAAIRNYVRRIRGENRKAVGRTLKRVARRGVYTSFREARPYLMVTADDRAKMQALSVKWVTKGRA